MVHGDLYYPINPMTPSGSKMFLLLVDHYNRYMWRVPLPSKYYALNAIKHVQMEAEAMSRKKLKCLCTYRGGEFTSTSFNNHCVESGVWCHTHHSRMVWWNVGTR
jgi:hypothetical protein